MVEKRASSGLLDSGHAVLRMRVNVGTQHVGRDTPIDGLRDCYDVFGRRYFFFAEIEPLPDMTLANFTLRHIRNNGICQCHLPIHQINCFL